MSPDPSPTGATAGKESSLRRLQHPARPRRRLWRVCQHRRINCIAELLNNGRRVRPEARDLGRTPGETRDKFNMTLARRQSTGGQHADATALRFDARPSFRRGPQPWLEGAYALRQWLPREHQVGPRDVFRRRSFEMAQTQRRPWPRRGARVRGSLFSPVAVGTTIQEGKSACCTWQRSAWIVQFIR